MTTSGKQTPATAAAPRRPADTRNLILDAAEEVVLNRGGRELTLELAAQAAGLSKGGVLYHFPTKAALIGAMLTRLIERFEAELDVAAEGAAVTEQLAFYIQAGFSACEQERRVGAALLAVLAEDKTLLEPLRAFYQRRFDALRRPGFDFSQGAVAMLAVEGLFLLDLLELTSLNQEERSAIEQRLLESLRQQQEKESDA